MASTETDGFKSKYRREPREPRASGTRDRRRMFEENANNDTNNSTVKSSITTTNSSTTASSRTSRLSRPATSSPSKTDDEPTINDRVSNMTLNDEQPADNNDQNDQENDDKKTLKKERNPASIGSSHKRRQKKNIREKRKSTGVVHMPGQPVVARDEEERQTMENTARNIEDNTSAAHAGADGSNNEELLKQIEKYEQNIEDWKDELSKAKREIESLRNDNTRLKDENSALLRVVGSLTSTGRK